MLKTDEGGVTSLFTKVVLYIILWQAQYLLRKIFRNKRQGRSFFSILISSAMDKVHCVNKSFLYNSEEEEDEVALGGSFTTHGYTVSAVATQVEEFV